MKKPLCFMALFLFLLMTCPAFGLDVSVDIKGSQDLMSLKDGLTRTITARCVSRNVNVEDKAALNVSIFQMGSTISLDAILSSKPPKAFHRDLKSTDELSAAIDAMIAEIFTSAPPAAVQAAPVVKPSPKDSKPELKLPFEGSSLIFLGDTLFVSSNDTIYKIEGGTPKPWWKAPKGIQIFRLYPYRDSIVAVASTTSNFFSYLLKDGNKVKSWNYCVIPSGDGLISSKPTTPADLSDDRTLWTKTKAVDGSPRLYPENTDILSLLTGDVSPEAGEETIAFDAMNHVVILSGKKTLWASDRKISTLPFYVQNRQGAGANSLSKKAQTDFGDVRYYLMPRVVLKGKEIITIANLEGASGLFGKVKIYEGTKIVAFTPQDSEFEEKGLWEMQNSYCTDITLDKGNVLALIVKKSTSFIQRVDLQ